MKYKIVASIIIVGVILMTLAIKGCNKNTPTTDEEGNPISTTETTQ